MNQFSHPSGASSFTIFDVEQPGGFGDDLGSDLFGSFYDQLVGPKTFFDAKNYSQGEPVGDTHDKMLAYLNNFDTNFGALIYPNHPEDWDRQTEPENETL